MTGDCVLALCNALDTRFDLDDEENEAEDGGRRARVSLGGVQGRSNEVDDDLDWKSIVDWEAGVVEGKSCVVSFWKAKEDLITFHLASWKSVPAARRDILNNMFAIF